MNLPESVKGLITGLVPQNELPQKLETWEDHIAAYQQAEEVTDAATWYKVDILYSLVQKFGEGSLKQFKEQVKVREEVTTLREYVRTAQAFPPEKRIPAVSYEGHKQASYADTRKNGQFIGENRFQILEQAANGGLASRAVRQLIQQQKLQQRKEEAKGTDPITCKRCGSSEPEVYKFIFYSPEIKSAIEVWLHKDCFDDIVANIERTETVVNE